MSYERHPLEMDPNIERCSDCGEGLDYCACPDAEQQRKFRARLDDLEAKVDATKASQGYDASDALRADRTAREEAALSAADAHDRAHGIHRITLDDATVERAARIRYEAEGGDWDAARAYDKAEWIFDVRAVLAAAVQEER